ncbi:MAG TPA: phosphoribosylamine--glycine ligase N-terminal domain-containing protein, partial [Acidothermaceae bacterium]|nr:phosphoribosylamine--glycine ligase N-terminal domain-containing protein [Acidothermaceae bacterium]
MNVLVIGGGAREHALCVALRNDATVTALQCAPGNAGIAAIADVSDIDVKDPDAVADL